MSGFDNTSFTTRTVTGTTDTLTANDAVVIYTSTSAKTVNLPLVSQTQPGRRYAVINAAAGAATVTPVAPAQIDGSSTLVVAATVGRAEFITDGNNWFTISVKAT